MSPQEQMAAVLRSLIAWSDKVGDEDADGGSYLNGDSQKHPGDGWDDLDKIVADARAALTEGGVS